MTLPSKHHDTDVAVAGCNCEACLNLRGHRAEPLPSKELVERYEKHVQAAGFLRLGAENKRLLAQFADWLSSETNEHPALKAGDELAHQSVYSPLHERWWQARGGHDKCTVCVPGNPHTAEWFCLCGEPLPDPRADCPKCTPLKASTETLLQQPVAWRCKNGFGDWRYTSVSPVSSPYSPAYEPLYVRAESKAAAPQGKPCTCPDTSATACGVGNGHKLGELWYCRRTAENGGVGTCP